MNAGDWLNFVALVLWVVVAFLHWRLNRADKRLRQFFVRTEALVTRRCLYEVENWERERLGLPLARTMEDYEALLREFNVLSNLIDRNQEPVVKKTERRTGGGK